MHQSGDCNQGDSLSENSWGLFYRGEVRAQYICDFGKGVHATKKSSWLKVTVIFQRTGILVFLMLFSVWVGARNWVHKIFSRIYLSRGQSVSFCSVLNASIWSSPWIYFRVYYRLVTAVANGLILIKLDGGQHSLFYNPFPFGLNFDQGWEGILWLVCPTEPQECLGQASISLKVTQYAFFVFFHYIFFSIFEV